MPENVKVAISTDFFSAFSKLPQAQQGKVSKFIINFQKNPVSSAINYEKIAIAKDPNMRSVRIDQAYRGIVLKPEKGNVYLLLWVDHHDEAYDWAARHKCTINPETGAVQVFEAVDAGAANDTIVEPVSGVSGQFDELKDKELVRLGVPEELMPVVRGVRNELELDAIENRLPLEAYEGLFMYMAGSRYDEIINEREQKVETVDTEDFSTALDKVESMSRFVVVDNELELAKMLNEPLEKWRVFLHPSQRKLVKGKKNGPCRVLGGAGTGKTVVAMHRAKWLTENALQDNQRILFTTFTKNLATDIENNLKSICSPETMKRIEVINLDRWVRGFLRKRNYEYKILYGSDSDRYWDNAMDLKPLEVDVPDSFYKEEWLRVMQPQDIDTKEKYIRASRVGRGTRLSRADRVKIWPVFEEYRNQLNLHKSKEVDDAYRDATKLLIGEEQTMPYQSVVVDEAQDMSAQAFLLMRQIVDEGPNDMFIVGDGHQRIYGKHKVVLSHCGINIRGRARKLRINYRTTEEIRRWAVRLLEGKVIDDLDGGIDTNDGYKSLTHGDEPVIKNFASAEDQSEYLANYLKGREKEGVPLGNICVVARTNKEVDSVAEDLKRLCIEVKKITADSSEHGHDDAVRVATMHRVKGLEFDEMALASINQGLVPLDKVLEGKGDVVERRQADLEERALVYVAITRAKKVAVVLNYGGASPYLAS